MWKNSYIFKFIFNLIKLSIIGFINYHKKILVYHNQNFNIDAFLINLKFSC